MSSVKKAAITAGMAILAAGAAGGVAMATGDDGDQTVSGKDTTTATAAALKATGGGRANSVELDSENGATWEVEVTKTDGATVDVRLDDQFAVVVIEGDQEDGNN
jgi:uncharacterized membrane protein YkoI